MTMKPAISYATVTSLIDEESVHVKPVQRDSSLYHWPVQFHLVPVKAPFWDNADLLLMADFVPVAHPDLHKRLLTSRSVMIGCLKFDNARAYVEKLTQILQLKMFRALLLLT